VPPAGVLVALPAALMLGGELAGSRDRSWPAGRGHERRPYQRGGVASRSRSRCRLASVARAQDGSTRRAMSEEQRACRALGTRTRGLLAVVIPVLDPLNTVPRAQQRKESNRGRHARS
jgi:hypothetical protein